MTVDMPSIDMPSTEPSIPAAASCRCRSSSAVCSDKRSGHFRSKIPVKRVDFICTDHFERETQVGRCYAAAWALLCCCLDAAMLIHSTVSMSSADHLACCLFRRGSAPQRWSGTYAASTTARGGPCSATWKARCAGCTRRSCARSASSALWRALSRALSTDHTIERGRFNDYRTFCLTLPNILPTNLGKSTKPYRTPPASLLSSCPRLCQ